MKLFLQIVKSTIVREPKRGDLAVSINCHALQDETPTWTRFSDAHDIVIAQVSWPCQAPLPARSAEQLAPAEEPSLPGAADSTTVPEAAAADERPPAQMTHSTLAEPAEPGAPAAARAPAEPAPVPQRGWGQPAVNAATTAPGGAPAAAAAAEIIAEEPALTEAPAAAAAAAAETPDDSQKMFHSSAEELAGSAEQPAPKRSYWDYLSAGLSTADNLGVPLKDTPLSLQFIANLAVGDEDNDDAHALEELEKTFMFRDVPGKSVPGHWHETLAWPLRRLEWVLELLQEQRDLHKKRLQRTMDPRVMRTRHDIHFSDEDMIIIMNEWRSTPDKWMQPRSSQKLQTRSRQQRHQTIKSSFSAMKFQLLGNAALVDHIIRFNLCGAAEPAMVRNFCDRWRQYTETDEYRKARQESQKCESDHVRRSKQIYHLREQVWRAEWVASWIAEDNQNWYKLEASEQNLWTNMDELRTKLHDVLRTPPGVRHAGAGSGMANM